RHGEQSAAAEGDAEPDDPAEDVRPGPGGRPRQHGAPVMTDHHRLGLPQRLDETDTVRDELGDPVVVDPTWFRRPTVSAEVRGDGTVAGLGDHRDLVTPGMP